MIIFSLATPVSFKPKWVKSWEMEYYWSRSWPHMRIDSASWRI